MTPRLVLVLGMHRSGTSMMAAGLPCLGVSLGDALVGRGPDNTRGFWEDAHVLDLDAAVLKAVGQDWDTSSAIPATDLTGPATTRFGRTGRRLLTDRLSRFPLFGLKEPRFCRLLPFWRPLLDDTGCAVSVVHLVRNPTAVAHSLASRNGMAIVQGLDLWRRYVLDAFTQADPAWRGVVVAYQTMMEDPVGQLRRVDAALDLVLDEPQTEAFARSFVDPALWHQRQAAEPSEEIGDIWRLCREAAADRLGVGELTEQLRAL